MYIHVHVNFLLYLVGASFVIPKLCVIWIKKTKLTQVYIHVESIIWKQELRISNKKNSTKMSTISSTMFDSGLQWIKIFKLLPEIYVRGFFFLDVTLAPLHKICVWKLNLRSNANFMQQGHWLCSLSFIVPIHVHVHVLVHVQATIYH